MLVKTHNPKTMKKILLVLLVTFGLSLEATAQELEEMIVLRDDLDSCDIIRPDAMPKDFRLDYVSLYYYTRISPVLDYPEEAKNNHIQGNVLLTFRITKDCKITDYKIFKGLGYGLDELALKYANLVCSPTEPAKYHGEKVDVLYMMRVSCTYEPAWPITIAKNFSLEKMLNDEAILIGNHQDKVHCHCVNDASEISFVCKVPYVRFKVKRNNGKIAKVKLEKSSGFKPLDDEAIMALWNLEYWEGGRMEKDVEYIVPVSFDANLED